MSEILLSSGGLDSAVLAAMTPAAVHLSVDYGQRHRVELEHAAAIAAHYGAEHILAAVDLAGLAAGSTLTGAPGELSGPATVVPGRNMVLLALGAALAEARGGGVVLIGCNADDAATYPDCRPAFIAAAATVLADSSSGRVEVAAPLLGATKPQIGALAVELSVPVELTWSCYAGGPTPCGACGACAERKRALG